MAWSRLRIAILFGVLVAVRAPTTAEAQGLSLETTPLASGLSRPVAVVDPGDGSGRLFIVEQTGKILIHDGTGVLTTEFLDLSAKIEPPSATPGTGELGLLGLAFHPHYPVTPYFYVSYTEDTENVSGANDLMIARYQVSAADPNIANPASEQLLMSIFEPFRNHNGGHLAFGPDGFLYISSGDGGSGGDPQNRAQNLDTVLGKLLRIDVDSTPPAGRHYAIPVNNPFAALAEPGGDPGCSDSNLGAPIGSTCDEIWAYGLRNPWRFSFDWLTDDLYLGDVGQNSWEEIDFQPAASTGGENYGWRVLEGTHCYPPDESESCTPPPAHVLPVLEYEHGTDPCSGSVTGGFVYRGSEFPQLEGVYVYADFCKGTMYGTVPRCDGVWESQVLLDSGLGISTFGEDADGELLVADMFGGGLHRLGLAPSSGGPSLQVSPMPIDFGASETVEVTLTNTNLGPEALKIEDLFLADGSDFSLNISGGTAPCSSTSPCLPPGVSCTVELTFSGTGLAWFETLEIPGNSPLMAVPVGVCTADDDPVLTETVDGEVKTFDGCNSVTTGSGFLVTGTGKAIEDRTFRAIVAVTFLDQVLERRLHALQLADLALDVGDPGLGDRLDVGAGTASIAIQIE